MLTFQTVTIQRTAFLQLTVLAILLVAVFDVYEASIHVCACHRSVAYSNWSDFKRHLDANAGNAAHYEVDSSGNRITRG